MTNRALVLLALVLATSACGDSDDSQEPDGSNRSSEQANGGSTSAEDEAAVREVAEGNIDAIYGDDPASACEDYTERYQQMVVDDAKSEGLEIDGDSCEAVMVGTAALVKAFAPEPPKVGKVSVDGDRAKVSITTGDGDPSVSILVREGDSWLLDGEEEGAGGDNGEPTKDEVRQWPAEFCSLQPGATKAEVTEVMGEPTGEFDGSGGEQPQLTYDAYGYSFTVFLDINDEVDQLYVNELGLSNAQREAMTCDLVRSR